jgi:nucleotide-binding universal stress UspA family protein
VFEYRKIIATTDFSDQSLAGVRRAADLAGRFGADLTVVYVVDDRLPALILAASSESVAATVEKYRKRAAKTLETYVSTHLPGMDNVESVVLTGSPHEAVVELARERQVDLIVVGTHGHGFVGHVLMGSTAERILHHAPCPVLVVRPSD